MRIQVSYRLRCPLSPLARSYGTTAQPPAGLKQDHCEITALRSPTILAVGVASTAALANRIVTTRWPPQREALTRPTSASFNVHAVSMGTQRVDADIAGRARKRATIEPVVVDLSGDAAEVKTLISSAVQKTPPMFAITNYGFEDKFVKLVGAVRRHHGIDQSPNSHPQSRCVSLALSGLDEGNTEADLRNDLCSLTWRVCNLLMGPKFEQMLAAENLDICGSVSLRFYPQRAAESQESSNLLGAHVDGNFITMLWSDAPGFQVPGPSAPVEAHDVASIGIPTVGSGGVSEMTDEDWADVVCPAGALLVTIGQGWFQSPASQIGPAVPCPTLHRVSIDGVMPHDRHSFPFLARLERKREE